MTEENVSSIETIIEEYNHIGDDVDGAKKHLLDSNSNSRGSNTDLIRKFNESVIKNLE